MIKPPILYTKKLLPSSPLLSVRLKQWRGKENNVQLMSVQITIVTPKGKGKDQAERMGND